MGSGQIPKPTVPSSPPDLDDDEKILFGAGDDYSWRFDPSIGSSGSLVARDEVNGQDRLEVRVGDVARLLAQNLDLNGNELASLAAIDGGITGDTRIDNLVGSNLSVTGGQLDAAGGSDPIYGDGSDGAISRSGNANENGHIQATTYEIQSGVTMSNTTGQLIITATESITISGTISGNSVTGGGSGGNSDGENGSPGSKGLRGAIGTGGGSESNGGPGAGGGGSNDSSSADGSGGDASATLTSTLENNALPMLPSAVARPFFLLDVIGASGGGGGGAGGISSGNVGNGGNGGNAGASVILIAPSVTLDGTVSLDAANGTDGAANSTSFGGGGGGGSGGVLLVISNDITSSSLTFSATAGTGGVGGRAAAGDGGDGAAGQKIEVPA